MFVFGAVSGVSRAKIDEITLDALRTRQSLVKGERLVRDEMRAVLDVVSAHFRSPHIEIRDAGKPPPQRFPVITQAGALTPETTPGLR